ncbi:MAG: MurR/RpiR family transcriptional regulator [Gammaproteobacteria bacterium]|nr:MurR/RpiR family transcriptional regulator [Gammaproteobacteria bacterium]
MENHYTQTIGVLVDSYPKLTPELQKAAKFILNHPEDVGLNSLRKIAGQAGVKPATISRLSKALGYEAYEQLREPFRQRLRKSGPGFAARLQDLQRRGVTDTHALYEESRTRELGNIAATLSDDQFSVFEEAVETLWTSRRVYVLGLRGAYAPAFLFHYTHQLFHDKCQMLDTRAGVFADQLRGLNEQDALLVVSFPPYTQLTIDAVDYAAESGVQIVAITDSVLSPAAHSAKHTIVTSNESSSFYHSFIGALAACQTLITLLVAKSGQDSVEIVKEAEKQLSRISAYW